MPEVFRAMVEIIYPQAHNLTGGAAWLELERMATD